MSSLSVLYALAAALAVGVGIAHSVLGERYILIRLFRRSDLPRLFGGTEFTVLTLRFAWHLTTVAWFGFAAFFWSMAQGWLPSAVVAPILSFVFLTSAAITGLVSRGRHLAWPVFLAIGVIALYGSQA
jgi:hypothetical protein